jgi:hypothetical protein
MLAAEGIATVGIDPAAALLDEARRQHPQGDYRAGGAEALEFANGAGLAEGGAAARPASCSGYAARKPLDGKGVGMTVTVPLRISPSGLPSGSRVRPKKLFRKIAPAA